jgi:general L-amino acid transport system permease protein
MRTAPLTFSQRMQDFLRSCVSSPRNVALTLAFLLLIAWILPGLMRWLFIDAVWSGSSGRDCAGHDAACWIFLQARAEQLLYGDYPAGERWRLAVAALTGVAALGAVATFYRRLSVPAIVVIFSASTIVIGVVMAGGALGLRYIPTGLWGGAALTVVIASWTIVTALPLGLLLALARRSELPFISVLAAALIDLVRSLPLVGLLFLSIVMFPLFVPPGLEVDKLMRALIAFTVFNAASFAEVFRGALQAIPDGQIEGGRSLGLSRRRVTTLIVIPQVLSISVPAIVNVCIAIIKETTIVLILGLFDFVGVLQAGMADPNWLMADTVRTTAYVFAAFVFWVICFSLSRYSHSLERNLPAAKAVRGTEGAI